MHNKSYISNKKTRYFFKSKLRYSYFLFGSKIKLIIGH